MALLLADTVRPPARSHKHHRPILAPLQQSHNIHTTTQAHHRRELFAVHRMAHRQRSYHAYSMVRLQTRWFASRQSLLSSAHYRQRAACLLLPRTP